MPGLKRLIVPLFAVALAGCAVGQGQPTSGDDTSADTNLERLAQRMERKGDYGAAAQFYRQSIQNTANPSAAQLSQLGETLYKAGRFEQAEAVYKRARERAPKNPDIHYRLGRTRIALDRPQAALDSFEAAQRHSQTAATRIYIGKGVALDLLGRHAEAQRVYQRGLQDAPDDLRLLNNYGLSLALDGQYDAAVQVLGALAKDPQAGEKVRQNLALAHALAGDMQQASEFARYDLNESEVEANLQYYAAVRDALPANSAAQPANAAATPTPAKETGPKSGSASRPSGDAAKHSDHWVQLGAYRQKDVAQRTWREIARAHPEILDGLTPKITKFKTESNDTFYRIRTGPFRSAGDAKTLCKKLLKNDQSCVPVDATWSSS